MRILALNPGKSKIDYSLFDISAMNTSESDSLSMEEFGDHDRLTDGLRKKCIQCWQGECPSMIAVHIRFGGETCRSPVVVSESVIKQIESIAHEAPLHLPFVVELCLSLKKTFQNIPLIAAFGTSFFVDLPERERCYATSGDDVMKARRFGYHGIYHHAGVNMIVSKCHDGRRPKILSLCMEPHPELCATMGIHPVMVSGGATPMEGLPGETTCGCLDAGIITGLAGSERMGVEQIDMMLSRKSGMSGLIGQHVSFPDLMRMCDPKAVLARRIFRYRLLLDCGAGVAAMGGVDGIVVSGKYASCMTSVVEWLRKRMRLSLPGVGNIDVAYLNSGLHQLLAELCLKVFLENQFSVHKSS